MAIVCNTFDKRIKDFSHIQSLKEYDDKYIGKSGYFSDSLCSFKDLNNCFKGTLDSIDKDDRAGDYIFYCTNIGYRYFLPEVLLKKVRKKFRPYSLEEFLDTFKIGDVITYRMKGSTLVEHEMFIGYSDKSDKNPEAYNIKLGSYFNLEYLFREYELFLNDEWQPFGVEDK